MTATGDLFSIGYTYEKGGAEAVEGKVEVPQSMQFDPNYVKRAVAKQIAEEFRQEGKSVWLDGRSVIAETSNVERSSCQRINVFAVSCEPFELECYAQGAPVRPVHDK